ncbi:MAG: ABC transporter substrate-binding protein [Anaerolineales bacterium]
MVFLPFVKPDKNGELEGRLATSWEHSEDYRTWTIRLRTDVRWHDGVPVTAHDVKFTIDLLRKSDLMQFLVGEMSAAVVDDSTVVITYDYDRASLDGWTVYYPKHLLEDLEPKDIFEWDFWKNPVGNGPYRYVRHVPKTMLELEANPDYYAGPPSIKRVVIKFGEPNLPELLSGNVDVLSYVEPLDVLSLADDDRYRAYYTINPRFCRSILWFQKDPLFRDARVRKALTMAIDRRQLLHVLNMPEFIPITDAPYTKRQFRRGEIPEPLPFDPHEAGRLLENAGWRDTNRDGIRELEGREFHFTALVPSLPGFELMAVFIQDNLRRIGVRMDIRILDTSVVRNRLEEAQSDLSAAFFLLGCYPESLQEYFGVSSIIGYHNQEIYPLLDQLVDVVNPDKVDLIYGQIAEILSKHLPVTFLMPRVVTFIAHQRLRGLSSPFRAIPSRHMEDLWIEEEK